MLANIDRFLSFLNIYRKYASGDNRVLLVKARSEYECTIKACKKRYVDDRITTLELYRHKNAKLYWKMLKQSAHVKSHDIPSSSFEEYFKADNNPELTKILCILMNCLYVTNFK